MELISKHFLSLNLPADPLKLFLVLAASCSAGSWHPGATQGWCPRTRLRVVPAPGLGGKYPHAQETGVSRGQTPILGDAGGCLPSRPPGWRQAGVLGAASAPRGAREGGRAWGRRD